MIIAGIDIGLKGGLAFLVCAGESCTMGAVCDMPVLSLSRGQKTKMEVDAHQLADLLEKWKPGHAFVEQVGAMPGQGVSSMFAFGKAYGIVLGVLATLGTPMTLVTPQKWKKAMGVQAAKDAARARASQLMPSSASLWTRVKDDGRAEAALIGLYGCRTLMNIAEGTRAV